MTHRLSWNGICSVRPTGTYLVRFEQWENKVDNIDTNPCCSDPWIGRATVGRE